MSSPLASHRTTRGLLAACGAVLACLLLAVGSSYGGLTATILGTSNTTGSATLLFEHTYAGATTTCASVTGSTITASTTFPCPSSLAPSAAVPASGSAAATDAVRNRGSVAASAVTQTITAASCGAVQLANRADVANPALARYGTTFAPTTGPMSGSGSITLDGGSPGGYEASILSQTQPATNAAVYGVGVWFKAATATTAGPLFGIGTSPINTSGSDDRILYRNSDGTLSFVQNTTGAPAATTRTTTPHADVSWHFAYVRLMLNGNTSTTTLTVDADPAVVGGGKSVMYGNDTGYWRLGWSPLSGIANYFTGSLSNFVVFGAAGAPVPPTSNDRASQANFDTWAGAATEHWRLNDTGTSTYSGTLPVLGTTTPCSTVNVSVGSSSPTSCAYSPASATAVCTDPPAASLDAFANNTARPIASSAPATTQTLTVKTTRGTGYATGFMPGLRLYVPLTITCTSGSWTNSFTWTDASGAFLG